MKTTQIRFFKNARSSCYIIRKDGQLFDFKGQTIPSVVVVMGKNNTSTGGSGYWEVALAQGAELVVDVSNTNHYSSYRAAMSVEANTFESFAERFKVSVEAARSFLEANYPNTFLQCVETEEALKGLNQ